MKLGLNNKKVIVTGGSRGIGKAILQNMIDEGASIATCARGEKALTNTLETWRNAGATVYGDALDVTDQQQYTDWFNTSVAQLGGLDVFVSNVTSRVTTEGEQRWQDTFEVDLMQHIRATELAIPHLKKSTSPSIVYIASIASVMTTNMPTETEYGVMKAALISYATQLASRLGKDNIRVNLVSPGPIYHEGGFWQMVEAKQPNLYARAQAISVFNRLGTAQEVANAVTFLASPAASNITGANLRVDGGAIKTVNF